MGAWETLVHVVRVNLLPNHYLHPIHDIIHRPDIFNVYDSLMKPPPTRTTWEHAE